MGASRKAALALGGGLSGIQVSECRVMAMPLSPSDVVPGPKLGKQSLLWEHLDPTHRVASMLTTDHGLTPRQAAPSSEHLRDLGL